MATKLLKEVSRATVIEATAKNGEYEYVVHYDYSGKELKSLRCNVCKMVTTDGGEERVYGGYIGMDGGNKALNIPADGDIIAHVTMFEKILAEVKTEVEAV